MKFQIENGAFVGTAEWRASGAVTLDMVDPEDRRFLEGYLNTPYSALGGPVDCPVLRYEVPDSSAEAFERAMYRLAELAYEVKRLDNDAAESFSARERRSA